MSLGLPYMYVIRYEALGLVFQPGTVLGAGSRAYPHAAGQLVEETSVTIGCGKGYGKRGRGWSKSSKEMCQTQSWVPETVD